MAVKEVRAGHSLGLDVFARPSDAAKETTITLITTKIVAKATIRAPLAGWKYAGWRYASIVKKEVLGVAKML